MSMSTHIAGFREADSVWNKMRAVLESCITADVDVPDEVSAFFDHDFDAAKNPGMEVDIDDAVAEYSNEYKSGFQVDVTKLPPGVRFVRFYNAY